MRIIGFNFTKISIEKLKELTESPKINTEMDLPDIKEVKAGMLKTKDIIFEAKFVYNVNYEPDFAKISIEGRVILSVDQKTAKEVNLQWKKKKLPEDFRFYLLNIILRKSASKAMFLEDELNLPLHVALPSLKRPEEK